ncbi:hypothetical protein EG329_008784 [Mollisiaceae sp. DMI_Dod_QoI]|nr:hypothetical protein EG329_008784 [Helotiales sp. DMI_Dod_QoI]
MSYISPSAASSTSCIPRKPLPLSNRRIVQAPSQQSELLQSEQSQSKNVKPTGKNSGAGAKWIVGWKTPVAMISCYILALLISIAHLSMFIFLDNKPIASYHQSYVTTTSTILASIFGLSLKGALGIAFTQSLWRVLRKSAQKLRLIEDLFTMRSYPYMALRRVVLRKAPLLSVFTIMLWSLEIVTNFPPGALTVTSKPHSTTNLTTVMALNTSYLGTGNFSGLQDTSIAVLALSDSNTTNIFLGIQEALSGDSGDNQTLIRRESVLRLASDTMVTGAIATHPSPCGLNCTYNLRFVGPYMICDPERIDFDNLILHSSSIPYYFGVWSNPQDDVVIPYYDQAARIRRAESMSVASFNTSIYAPLGLHPLDYDVFVEEHFQQCRPGQATYNINVTYRDGAQTFDIQTEPESVHTNLQWVSDANNMAIIESMALALAGQYSVVVAGKDGAYINYTTPDGLNITLIPISTSDDSYDPVHLVDQGQSIASSGPQNGTIISSTAINQRARYYNISNSEGPDLIITQDILNEMLQNITLSLMNSFGLWTTEVNTTTSTFRNVYSFSDKLNLLLPYYLSLIISLPLLAIGGACLHSNGVSAIDGGFLQILMTTSNSKALHEVASDGALGGQENVPEELKELKVRYGELVGGEEKLKAVRMRAGFGVEDEVVSIRNGKRYGGVSDTRNSFGSLQSTETAVLLNNEN